MIVVRVSRVCAAECGLLDGVGVLSVVAGMLDEPGLTSAPFSPSIRRKPEGDSTDSVRGISRSRERRKPKRTPYCQNSKVEGLANTAQSIISRGVRRARRKHRARRAHRENAKLGYGVHGLFRRGLLPR